MEKKKTGRPPKSASEIEKLAEKILEWCEKEDAFAIRGFAAEMKVPPATVRQWAFDHEVFRNAYEHAKNTLGLRRERNTLLGIWKHAGLVERTHAMYDEEYLDLLRTLKQLDQEGILDKAITLVREVKSET